MQVEELTAKVEAVKKETEEAKKEAEEAKKEVCCTPQRVLLPCEVHRCGLSECWMQVEEAQKREEVMQEKVETLTKELDETKIEVGAAEAV